MALSNAALVAAAEAVEDAVTHMQLHSAAPGPNGTANTIGTRVAVTGSVDGDGDITWTSIHFTGLDPEQAVHSVSYWSADTGGVFLGSSVLTGDATANSGGEYTVTSVTESSTAS